MWEIYCVPLWQIFETMSSYMKAVYLEMQQSPDLVITINLCVSLWFMCLLQHNGCSLTQMGGPGGIVRVPLTLELGLTITKSQRCYTCSVFPVSPGKDTAYAGFTRLTFLMSSPQLRPSLSNTFSGGPSWEG